MWGLYIMSVVISYHYVLSLGDGRCGQVAAVDEGKALQVVVALGCGEVASVDLQATGISSLPPMTYLRHMLYYNKHSHTREGL
jgi:hypothetical protein